MNPTELGTVIRDTKAKIAGVLVNSGLPLDILVLLLGNMYLELNNQSEQIYLSNLNSQNNEVNKDETKDEK